MPSATVIGKELRLIRERLGESQADLAERLGINKNTLGTYERGHLVPDEKFVVRFARLTKSDADALVRLRNASVAPARGGLHEPPAPPISMPAAQGRPIDWLTLVDCLMLIEDTIAAAPAPLSSNQRLAVTAAALVHALTTPDDDDALRRYTEEVAERMARNG